ncbi:MAG: M20/M25/M40 family metallo-hydrolase [Planctomycetaceae bacterium]|nr:M20/M25/M40 family metallo-hydrolase [Planctomycetaceae bacterium]
MTQLTQRILYLAQQVLSEPTAPYREHAVRQFIMDFCAKRGIDVQQDEVGNLLAVYGRRYKNPVFAFCAHMDHPGFIAERDSKNSALTAMFYGGVEDKYFANAKAVFYTQQGPVKGIVRHQKVDKSRRFRRVRLSVNGSVRRGDPGMWDLPAFRLKEDLLYSRACDDVIGCVSVLAILDELVRRNVGKKVMAVFTVAEEAGLQGAKHLCVKKTIPAKTHIVAIETSSILPDVNAGDGVVIRVGDRASIFTPALTAFLVDCAERARSADKRFRFQRKLMDGGTCESTVYNKFGYINAAVCIPLGNYHNRSVRTGRIAVEYVSVTDLENMVKLFWSIVHECDRAEDFLEARPPKYKRLEGSLGEFFYTTPTR